MQNLVCGCNIQCCESTLYSTFFDPLIHQEGWKGQTSPTHFCTMSGKRKGDYNKILKKMKSLVSGEIQIQKMVADFEAAVWRACITVFPNVDIQGCLFHWCQALRKKIGDMGLLRCYTKKGAVYHFLKKIMALPYLPKGHIPGAFYELKGLANSECLKDFCTDVERQWIVSDFFSAQEMVHLHAGCANRQRFGGLAQEAQLFGIWSSRPISKLAPCKLGPYKL